MVGCCAYRCKSRSEKKVPGLTFHRFPLKDPQRTDHWIQKLHIANWSPTKNDRICSKHFEDNLFYRIGNRICLKDEAMPTIFPELPKYLQQKPQPKRDRSFRTEVISQPSTSQVAPDLLPLDSQSDASRPLTPVRALEVVLEEINSSSRSSSPTTSPELEVDDIPRKVFSKRKLSERHKKDVLRSKKIRYLKKKGGGQKKKINNSEGVLLNLKKENLEENGEMQIRFPAEQKIRKKWFKNIGRQYEDTKYIYLCADHFSSNDIVIKTSGHRYLKQNAVPVTASGSRQPPSKRITASRRNSWLRALGRNPNDNICRDSFVCSVHFKKDQIKDGSLSADAIPTINLKPTSQNRLKLRLTAARYKPWLKAIGRNPNDQLSIRHNAICSIHFPPDSFFYVHNKKFLKQSALPCLNLRPARPTLKKKLNDRQDPLQSLPLAPSAGINTINSNSPGNIIFVNLSTHKTEPEESESELIGLPTVSNEPPFCIVCKKREDEDDGSNRSFHMFPRASNTYILWLCILNCDKSTPLKANARVCSDHFLAQHFVTNSDGIRYLSEAALPIVTLKSKLSEEPIRNPDTNPTITHVSQAIKPDGGLKGNESYDTEEIILVECNDMSAAPAQDSLIVNESTQVENKTDDDIVEQMPRGNETSTVPRYAEGCRLSDLSGLRTEKHNWEKANKAIIKQRNKIRSLHRLNRRLQAKVDQLSMSVTYLEGKLLRCTCTAETALEKFD